MTYDPEVKVTWLRMRIANAELAYSDAELIDFDELIILNLINSLMQRKARNTYVSVFCFVKDWQAADWSILYFFRRSLVVKSRAISGWSYEVGHDHL